MPATPQRIFHKGLRSLERTCRRRYGNAFLAATPAQQVELVTELDQEQYQHMRYRETPGRFDPCVPLTPSDTSWAEHA